MKKEPISPLDAVAQTIQKYKDVNDLPEDHQLDCEDTPIVGVFNNSFIIIHLLENGELKIDIRGDQALMFDDDINVFTSEK